MPRGNLPAARTRLLPLLAVAIVVVPAVAVALAGGLDLQRLAGQRDWLVAATARLGPAGPVLYAMVYAAIAGLSLPLTAPMSILAGFLFGRAIGLAAAVCGATAGAAIVLLLARTAFGEPWRRRAGPRIRRFEAGFRADAFFYLLTLRLLPVFPFWLVNFAAAFLGVKLRIFVAATALGIVPANLVFTSLGAGLGGALARGETPEVAILLTPAILLPLLALALLALAPVAYRLWRRRRAERREESA